MTNGVTIGSRIASLHIRRSSRAWNSSFEDLLIFLSVKVLSSLTKSEKHQSIRQGAGRVLLFWAALGQLQSAVDRAQFKQICAYNSKPFLI